MNEKNVQALARLISTWERDDIDTKDGATPSLAEWLASRGVLVPSVLTDFDVDQFTEDDDWQQAPDKVRAWLTALASDDWSAFTRGDPDGTYGGGT